MERIYGRQMCNSVLLIEQFNSYGRFFYFSPESETQICHLNVQWPLFNCNEWTDTLDEWWLVTAGIVIQITGRISKYLDALAQCIQIKIYSYCSEWAPLRFSILLFIFHLFCLSLWRFMAIPWAISMVLGQQLGSIVININFY